MPLSFFNLFNSKKSKSKKLTKFQEKLHKMKIDYNKKHKHSKTKKCCKMCGGRYWGTSKNCQMGLFPKCKESGCKK